MPCEANGMVYDSSKNIVLYTDNLTNAINELYARSCSLIAHWGAHDMALVYLSMPDIEINFQSLRPIPEIYTDDNITVDKFLKTIGIIPIPCIDYVEKMCTRAELITKAQHVADKVTADAYNTGAQ